MVIYNPEELQLNIVI